MKALESERGLEPPGLVGSARNRVRLIALRFVPWRWLLLLLVTQFEFGSPLGSESKHSTDEGNKEQGPSQQKSERNAYARIIALVRRGQN